jgi:predicted glycosyltransferase
MIEYFLADENEQTTEVYLVGEIGKSTVSDLLEKLTEAKKNNSPASIITSFLDQIYQKTLPQDISDLVIKIAKAYDKLYIYGSNEVVQAKAQFGNSLTEKDIIVHNTIIDVLTTYLKENGLQEDATIISYLDTYYAKYNTVIQTATSLGLL